MILPDSPDQLAGFDASTYHPIDWKAAIALKRFSFAFIQGAHGTEIPPCFASTFSTRDERLPIGVYQRFISGTPGSEHAQIFIEAFESQKLSFTDNDLPPVLDLERDPNAEHFIWTAAQYVQAIDEWISLITAHFHRKPILYMNQEFASFASLPERFNQYPLWFAHYAHTAPLAPQPWTSYAFWQSAQNRKLDNFETTIDVDTFLGNEAAFQQFITASKA